MKEMTPATSAKETERKGSPCEDDDTIVVEFGKTAHYPRLKETPKKLIKVAKVDLLRDSLEMNEPITKEPEGLVPETELAKQVENGDLPQQMFV